MRDKGVMGLVNGRRRVDVASCVKAKHKTPSYASFVLVALKRLERCTILLGGF